MMPSLLKFTFPILSNYNISFILAITVLAHIQLVVNYGGEGGGYFRDYTVFLYIIMVKLQHYMLLYKQYIIIKYNVQLPHFMQIIYNNKVCTGLIKGQSYSAILLLMSITYTGLENVCNKHGKLIQLAVLYSRL